MSERTVVAWHEAGHAVCSELLELPTGSASIAPNTHSAGRSLLTTGIGHLPPWRVAVWKFAGPAAERLYRRSAALFGSDDFAFVRELIALTKKSNEDAAALERRYQVLADAQVQLHYAWISRVADALLTHTTLSAHDVRRLRPREDRG